MSKHSERSSLLEKARDIFFIGIGGAGMSALARHFLLEGKTVRGYDRSESEFTRLLRAEGVSISGAAPDPAADFGKPDLVVFTPALSPDMPLLKMARESGCPLLKRAEVLGLISANRRTLAIAGTHGKTTISAMSAHLLRGAGVDTTAFLGGVSLNLGSNYAHGNDHSMVVEADEYDRSFLHLSPDVGVVTFTEPDHLDVYGSADSVLSAYRDFVQLLPAEGKLFVRHDDPGRTALDTRAGRLTYGLNEAADCRAANIRVEGEAYRFDFYSPFANLSGLRLQMAGRHNVENACAAMGSCLAMGAQIEPIAAALESFLGTRRRFEILYRSPELLVIDDYAHHPTELSATIAAAREVYPERRLVAVFQPHLYSRTRDFARDFASALERADEAVLLPVYGAREAPIPGVDSLLIADSVPGARLIEDSELHAFMKQNVGKNPTLILCAGAGSVSALAHEAVAGLARR